MREDHSVNGITTYQNGLGIDDKLRSKNGNVVRYFLTDHLGSTVALTDASGAIVSSTSYDSFGNATSNIATAYRYTGREYDADTGLYYYRNRWYDPETGRFISEDPIGFAGGDVNLYRYVWNNPLMYRDFFGLQGKPKKKPKPAKQPSAFGSLANRLKQIKKGSKEPPFQQLENLNPSTATSSSDFAKAHAWNGLKGVGGTAGIAVGAVEVAPQIAVGLDAIGRHKHDIKSLTDYATGKSEHPYTVYPPDAPADSQNKFYEDLSWWERFRCKRLWGPPCPPSKKDPVVCNTQC